MVKKLLNSYENLTHQRLLAACQRWRSVVFPKVRIADVLPISNSGIDSTDFSFALKSHFDFVVADEQHMPQFAAEFDGPSHNEEVRVSRDETKNRLCARFAFPLLRINAKFLPSTHRGMDLLSWLVEDWFLSQAFYEAQKQGHISPYEAYDPFLVLADSTDELIEPDKIKLFPLWPSKDVFAELRAFHRKGILKSPNPSLFVGLDDSGNHRAISWIGINSAQEIIANTAMRSQLFPSVSFSDLAGEIVAFELLQEVKRFMAGEHVPTYLDSIQSTVDEYMENYRLCYSVGHSYE